MFTVTKTPQVAAKRVNKEIKQPPAGILVGDKTTTQETAGNVPTSLWALLAYLELHI